MFGISLPIVATAVILIGQTATDAAPAFPAEIVQFEVRCHSNQLVSVQYWPAYRYQPGQKQIVIATDGRRIGEVRRIDLETMTYQVMWAEYVTESGVCKEWPQFPAPIPARQSADTTNTSRTEIKVVALETDPHPAVVIVSGQFRRGDNIRFFDAVEKIHAATVYLDSQGGDVYAAVGIGEIIRERGFHTAVINNGKCLSGCALVWLGGAKRYLGEAAQVGFHGPYVKKKVEISETLTLWAAETTTRARDIVADYITHTLDLKKEAADYVMEAPPQSLNYLTQEDGEKHGIAFTRMNVPGYDPLP